MVCFKETFGSSWIEIRFDFGNNLIGSVLFYTDCSNSQIMLWCNKLFELKSSLPGLHCIIWMLALAWKHSSFWVRLHNGQLTLMSSNSVYLMRCVNCGNGEVINNFRCKVLCLCISVACGHAFFCSKEGMGSLSFKKVPVWTLLLKRFHQEMNFKCIN